MKNILKTISLLLLISFYSSCTKEVVGDVFVAAVLNNPKTESKEQKEENCNMYPTEVEWKINNTYKGLGQKSIIKNGKIYSPYTPSFNELGLTVFDLSSGDILENIDISSDAFNIEHPKGTHHAKDIVLFYGTKHTCYAYDIATEEFIWVKQLPNETLELQAPVDGYLYSTIAEKIKDLNGIMINKIDITTGKVVEKIVIMPGGDTDNIETMGYFSISKNDQGETIVLFSINFSSPNIYKQFIVYNLNTKTWTSIYQESKGSYITPIIKIVEGKLYLNIQSIMYCYDLNALDLIWTKKDMHFRDVYGQYLITYRYNEFKVYNKNTGAYKYMLDNNSSDSNTNLYAYNNGLAYTNTKYIRILDDKGKLINTYISPSYCEGHNSSFKTIITDNNNNLIVSDGKYVMKLID